MKKTFLIVVLGMLMILLLSLITLVQVSPGFELSHVVSGLVSPTNVVSFSDGRLFLAEKFGKVRIIKNETLLDSSLLGISDPVNKGSNRGAMSFFWGSVFSINRYPYLGYIY